MTFGDILKSIRNSRSLTQEELGDALCLSRSYISELENGLAKPSIELVSEVSSTYKIEIKINGKNWSYDYCIDDIPFIAMTNEEWEKGTGIIAELRVLWNKAKKQ